MDFDWLPGATACAVVAFAIAMGYLAVARVGAILTDYVAGRRPPALTAPGARGRRELRRLDARVARHATALWLGGVSLALLAVLGRSGWWPALPLRAWVIIGLVLLIAAGYAIAKLAGLLRTQAGLGRALALEEGLVAGLAEVQLRGHRVHFRVPANPRPADAVITGPSGVHALFCIDPPRGRPAVRLAQGELVFEPSGRRMAIDGLRSATGGLETALREGTGIPAPVCPVLVLPGCRIEGSDDPRWRLTPVGTLVRLIDGRDEAAVLMRDEIRRIDTWLAAGAGGPPARRPAPLRRDAERRLRPGAAAVIPGVARRSPS